MSLLIAFFVFAISAQQSRGDVPVSSSWLTPTNGLWTTATNWSTDPYYPDNAQPNTTDTYDVVIDAAGSSYTVTLDSAVAIDSLTLDSAYATLNLDHGQLECPTILLTRGNMVLGSTDIIGAEITGAGTLSLDPAINRAVATFDGVTLGVDLTVPSTSGSPAGNRLTLLNGLTLLDDTLLEVNGLVNIEGSQTIDGTGTVLLNNGSLRILPDTMLTISPDVTILSTGSGGAIGYSSFGAVYPGAGLINEGHIISSGTTKDTNILLSNRWG